jgi:hypothetical protein
VAMVGEQRPVPAVGRRRCRRLGLSWHTATLVADDR